MDIEISRYQFHSWARKGIASTIIEPDDLGAGTSTSKQRAGINLPVILNLEARPKDFSLVGPGDIIGINREMIVRTQPGNRITDFEPNYLVFAEFYDEDFLWRYTPAAPINPGDLPGAPPTNKLRPWLFLLVVKEDEFERTKRKIPLPSIIIKSNDVFPAADETWLWAHVHNDANLSEAETNTFEEFLISLNKNVSTDPDQLYCRLMSPRKLEANTAYYSFLVPAFETGRFAGLGEDETKIKDIIAQTPSWSGASAGIEMPVYFEWFFRTGANEDFESLVKKLEPVVMDERVGIRDMDCSAPGFVKSDGTIPFPATNPAVLGLEGALKSPAAVSTVFPQEGDQFQPELEKIVNLPITIIGTDEDTGDPIISVPLYGGKHAKNNADDDILLDVSRNTWLHDLNKDPRTRVAAGFGTLAMQKNQETYMRKAWAQVQGIIDANKRVIATVFHMNIALQFAQKIFHQVSSNVLVAVSRPVLSRIMGSPTTLYQQIKQSRLPAAVLSGSFRKIAAPNRRFSKKYAGGSKFDYEKLVTGLNEGKLTASPPKETPGGVFTLKDAADKIAPNKFPGWMIWLLENRKPIAIISIVVCIILALVTGLYVLFIALAVAIAGGYIYAERLSANMNAAAELIDPQKELDAIPNIPAQPGFTLKLDREVTTPPPTTTSRNSDSIEARNYRSALIDMTKRLAPKEPEVAMIPLSLDNTYDKIKEGINPYKTFPKRLHATIKFPEAIKTDEPEKIFPVMAYPDMEDPMYKKLTDISEEAFLPNLQFIKNNTISLLVTNPKFIESYMVGLNHEMGRELLWREYPTDQRGSYFRQFWDVSGMISPSSPDGTLTATEKALYKDITPIHTWDEETEALGTHNNRQTETADEAQLVLTIRGDLFKKYPGILVFAQKAVAAAPNAEDNDDGTKIELELSDADFKKKVKFPLYRAEISPDIKLFGFDLTADRAKGADPAPDTDNLGWYFVIMQAPGAPVFGMDISFNPGNDGLSWDDLSWESFAEDIPFIQKDVIPTIHPADPIVWGDNSASMAYILFQKPNMIAVHAKKMLRGL
jgi:hypothetical protein